MVLTKGEIGQLTEAMKGLITDYFANPDNISAFSSVINKSTKEIIEKNG